MDKDGTFCVFPKSQQPEASRVKRQLRRRMRMVQEIEEELQKLEEKLSLPSPEAYQEMVRAGRPLTFDAHLVAIIHLIRVHLDEACLVAEEYASITPSQFARTTRLWRSDLLRCLGYAVELRDRPLIPDEEEPKRDQSI